MGIAVYSKTHPNKQRYMKLPLFILCVVAVGCTGSAELNVPVTMQNGCRLNQVYTEVDVYPLVVTHNFNVAGELMVQYGFFESEKDWCDHMQDMLVTIRNKPNFGSLKTGAVTVGSYDLFNGIELSRDDHMSSLVHEIFHSIDVAHFNASTVRHEGWDVARAPHEFSYNAVSDEYTGRVIQMLTAPVQPRNNRAVTR